MTRDTGGLRPLPPTRGVIALVALLGVAGCYDFAALRVPPDGGAGAVRRVSTGTSLGSSSVTAHFDVEPGDVLVVGFAAGASGAEVTAPDGWAQIGDVVGAVHLLLWSHVQGAADASDYAFTPVVPVGSELIGAAYRGLTSEHPVCSSGSTVSDGQPLGLVAQPCSQPAEALALFVASSSRTFAAALPDGLSLVAMTSDLRLYDRLAPLDAIPAQRLSADTSGSAADIAIGLR